MACLISGMIDLLGIFAISFGILAVGYGVWTAIKERR